jgi:hypothetical protein
VALRARLLILVVAALMLMTMLVAPAQAKGKHGTHKNTVQNCTGDLISVLCRSPVTVDVL